ncbi:MAG: methyltransferase domain-containing protein [Desulfobacterales bacterium]|nr:methyltransferase domain-containing protein [Desulfobacterales bacterium]
MRDLAGRGSWEYQDEGILDRTHLRFFTKKGFLKLLGDSQIHCDSVRNLYGEDLQRHAPAGPNRVIRIDRLTIEDVSDEEFEELSALQFLFTGTYQPESKNIETDEAFMDYQTAHELIGEGKIDDGIVAFEHLTKKHPEFGNAYNDLGVLYVQKGDQKKARSHYEEAVRLQPENVTFLKNLADFYAVVEGNTIDALVLYQKVISLQPEDHEALNALGMIATALGVEEEAAKFFSKSLQVDVGDPAVRGLIEEARTDPSLPAISAVKQPSSLQLRRVGSFDEYVAYTAAMLPVFEERKQIEEKLIGKGDSFIVSGNCVICRKKVAFHVDFFAAATDESGRQIPNWRERLICPHCGLINRCRAVIHIVEQMLRPSANTSIFIAEQTTPVYHWLLQRYPKTIGSEFLGSQIPLGSQRPDGIRNEDLTALTFGDGAFDCIMTYDVFEHVPDYQQAFRECCRVLKPGGVLMFTAPFDSNNQHTLIRARHNPDGTLVHLLPPEYHGDPLNRMRGCLCYQVFGWDSVEALKQAGFEDAAAYYYWSQDFGYLGGNQMVLSGDKE